MSHAHGYSSGRTGHQMRRPRVNLVSTSEMTERGTVKWYDAERSYGFISTRNGDVFVHKSVVSAYGLSADALAPGVEVRFALSPKALSGPRSEAKAIALVA